VLVSSVSGSFLQSFAIESNKLVVLSTFLFSRKIFQPFVCRLRLATVVRK